VNDEMETTETDPTADIMETPPTVKKTAKKSTPKKTETPLSVTELARARVIEKLHAAKRPPVNDYRKL
jgi:hypothetical protein